LLATGLSVLAWELVQPVTVNAHAQRAAAATATLERARSPGHHRSPPGQKHGHSTNAQGKSAAKPRPNRGSSPPAHPPRPRQAVPGKIAVTANPPPQVVSAPASSRPVAALIPQRPVTAAGSAGQSRTAGAAAGAAVAAANGGPVAAPKAPAALPVIVPGPAGPTVPGGTATPAAPASAPDSGSTGLVIAGFAPSRHPDVSAPVVASLIVLVAILTVLLADRITGTRRQVDLP
jgi:hypothetical protein